jgi:aspartate aminotransferase
VIFDALVATINPGDEAIIPAPCWVSYPDIVALAEGQAGDRALRPEPGLPHHAGAAGGRDHAADQVVHPEQPCNPTGAGYSAAELKGLAEVLLRHPDVWIFSDDIYEKLTYGSSSRRWSAGRAAAEGPHRHDERLLQGLCDDRLAHRLRRRPVRLIKAMDKLQSQSTSNTSSISQAAAIEALTGPQDSVEAMRVVYQRRATWWWPC